MAAMTVKKSMAEVPGTGTDLKDDDKWFVKSKSADVYPISVTKSP